MTREQRLIFGALAGTCVALLLENSRVLKQYNYLVDKYGDLAKRHKLAVQNWETHHEAVNYMLHILEERGVDLTEFDMIALKDIAEGPKGES